MTQLTHGSLFAGIGGFDLGFERAGIKTVWQVEIDPFCRKVLEKHWPNVQRFEDVKQCGAPNLAECDVVTGGFPCQDVSLAGNRAGLDGERSGLWVEMFRIICELRPRYIIVENVAGLLSLGMAAVLGDLAGAGFDAEWGVLSSCALGAPHTRQRVFIVAYPAEDRCNVRTGNGAGEYVESWHQEPRIRGQLATSRQGTRIPDWNAVREDTTASFEARTWQCEPGILRVVNGLSEQVDRNSSLGNAVDPQIAEWIGRRIVACHERGF